MKAVLRRQRVEEKSRKKSIGTCILGFTLIELVVVLAIIGIIAAIAAPNFSGYIHKLRVKEIVRQAKVMDAELSALIGRQYAEFGYMPSVSHQQVSSNGNPSSSEVLGTGSQTVDEKNYVMLNRVNGGGYNYCGEAGTGFTKPGGGLAAPFEYVTLANVQTGRVGDTFANPATEALRHSAGLDEFYRQTGIDLSGSAERVPGSTSGGNSELERRWYAIQFYSRSDIASGGSAPYLTTRYLHPDQCYFAFYEVKYDGTWYMVMHNAKFPGTNAAAWVHPDVPVADPGKWNVYKNSDPSGFAYDNGGGKPFGTILD